MNIPFSPPDISQREIDLVVEALKSGWITTGPKTKLFEKKIAEYVGTRRAVALNSATACMELTLMILGVGAGDEVITTAYTYTATASVICHVGATPILVDTQPDSYEMDYEKVKKAITPKTKVIMPVDIAGVMCDYDKLLEIVRETKVDNFMGRIAILADGAHSFGAIRNGKQSGSVADFTCFSFHAVKNLTTAEGGGVTWNSIEGVDDEEIYKKYMILSLHGQTKDALAKANAGQWEYDILIPAYKCNITDIASALGLAQLERYEHLLDRRHKIIKIYDNILESENVQILKHCGENFCSSGHLYLVRLLEKTEQGRNEIISKMAQKGISTNVHYKPLPMLSAYKNLGFDIGDFPNAYDMYKCEISLPLHTGLTDEEASYVANTLKEILKNS